jgi:hypothetical protein
MEDESRCGSIHVWTYFASIGLGLKWYDYEYLKRLHELRLATTAVGYLPARLKKLMAEEGEKMGSGCIYREKFAESTARD